MMRCRSNRAFAAKLRASDDAVDVKGVESDSGLLLRPAHNVEIVIVSSAAPFGVTPLADFIPDDFTPEYDLTRYKMVRGG